MSSVSATPSPPRMKLTRASLSTRAKRVHLSYFSYTTGTVKRPAANNIVKMAMKREKPESPAVEIVSKLSTHTKAASCYDHSAISQIEACNINDQQIIRANACT
jgi:hypothetical protein